MTDERDTVYVSLRRPSEHTPAPEQELELKPEPKPSELSLPVENHPRAERMLRPFKRAVHACAAGARRVVGRVRHAVHAHREAKATRAATAQ